MQILKQSDPCLSSNSCQSILKLKIPPPVYMFLFALMMWSADQLLPIALWLEQPWNHIGSLIMVLSILPAAGAFRLFNRFATKADPFHPEKASNLVTTGIYRYTRNPMYLALLMLLIGWALYLGSAIAALFPPLFVWLITVVQIKKEEKALQQRFAEAYLDYKRNVRRWL